MADEEKIGRVMTDPIVSWGSHPSSSFSSVYFFIIVIILIQGHFQRVFRSSSLSVCVCSFHDHTKTCSSCRCFQTTLIQQRRDLITNNNNDIHNSPTYLQNIPTLHLLYSIYIHTASLVYATTISPSLSSFLSLLPPPPPPSLAVTAVP